MASDHTPSHTRQIAAYTCGRNLKNHELALLDLIGNRVQDQGADTVFLDIGCADGLFLTALRERYPLAHLEGIEANESLIEQGKDRNAAAEIVIHPGDAYGYAPEKTYDVITASGILAVFDDPLAVLERWIGWLSPGGALFVFSLFNTQDVDTRVYFRNNYAPNGWETGLSAFSVESVRRHLGKLGVDFTFIPFELPIDLPKDENPIRSYTVRTEDGRRLVIAGNILCEFHHLIIRKPA